jgi:hypothetical protein
LTDVLDEVKTGRVHPLGTKARIDPFGFAAPDTVKLTIIV